MKPEPPPPVPLSQDKNPPQWYRDLLRNNQAGFTLKEIKFV